MCLTLIDWIFYGGKEDEEQEQLSDDSTLQVSSMSEQEMMKESFQELSQSLKNGTEPDMMKMAQMLEMISSKSSPQPKVPPPKIPKVPHSKNVPTKIPKTPAQPKKTRPLTLSLSKTQTRDSIQRMLISATKIMRSPQGADIDSAVINIKGFDNNSAPTAMNNAAKKKYADAIIFGLMGFLVSNGFAKEAEEVYKIAYVQAKMKGKEMKYKDPDQKHMMETNQKSMQAYVNLLAKNGIKPQMPKQKDIMNMLAKEMGNMQGQDMESMMQNLGLGNIPGLGNLFRKNG